MLACFVHHLARLYTKKLCVPQMIHAGLLICKRLMVLSGKKYLFLLNTCAALARIYLNERNRSIVSVTGLVSSSAQGVLLLD